MGYVAGASTINPFPQIPIFIQRIGNTNAGVYLDIYEQQVDFTNLTTLWCTYNWDDDGGANPITKLSIGGVSKFENDNNGTGVAIETVDLSAITGMQILLLQYKSANTDANISNVCIYAS